MIPTPKITPISYPMQERKAKPIVIHYPTTTTKTIEKQITKQVYEPSVPQVTIQKVKFPTPPPVTVKKLRKKVRIPTIPKGKFWGELREFKIKELKL